MKHPQFYLKGIIALILLTSCGTKQYEGDGSDLNGTITIKRKLRGFDFLEDYRAPNCVYIHSFSDCPEVFKLCTSQLNKCYKYPIGIDDLVSRAAVNITLNKAVAFALNEYIKSHYELEPKETAATAYSIDEPGNKISLHKGNYPGEMGHDSIRHYGHCYFRDKDQPNSFLLTETWTMKNGRLEKKEIVDIAVGFDAVDSDRTVYYFRIAGEELDEVLNLPLNKNFRPFSRQIALSLHEYISPKYPFGSPTFAQLYEEGLLFLEPFEIDEKTVDSKSRLKLITSDGYFGLKKPDLRKKKATFFISNAVLDPRLQFRFQSKEDILESIDFQFGHEFASDIFWKNIESANGLGTKLLLEIGKAAKEYEIIALADLRSGEKFKYDEDEQVLKLSQKLMLNKTKWNPKDAFSHVGIVLLQKFQHQNQSLSSNQIEYIVFVAHDPGGILPEFNFLYFKYEQVEEVLKTYFTETLTYEEFLIDFAFKTPYNVNGTGMKSYEESRHYLRAIPGLYPNAML